MTACASSATESPDSTDSAVRAPMPLIFRSWRNARRSDFAAEAEEEMRVLAHDEMSEEHDALARGGQVVERAHRHVDFVGDALHVEQDLRRVLLDEDSGEAADHDPRLWHAGRRRQSARQRSEVRS